MAKAKKAGSGGIKLENLKKHYFWIVLPLIVVLAFVFIFLAKSKIKKQYEEKSTAIESEKSAADTVAGNSKHPNQKTIDAIKAETDVLKQKVFGAWTLMYDDQKSRNRWPRQLSTEFRDLVENKLNFRDPIDPSKPYLLEDYGEFIAEHLPDLLKSVNRRRCQVREYKLLKKNEMDHLNVQGLEERFWPVYVSKDSAGKEFYYVGILSNPDDESSALSNAFLYNIETDLVSVADSALVESLKAGERVPYYRDVDPWIRNPRDMINFGVQTNNLSAIATAVAAAETGGAGGAGASGGMGAMGGSGIGGTTNYLGGGSGGAAGGSSSMGGSRGAMGGDMMGGGMATGGIPGDGYDPAEEQISGSTLEELAGGGTGMGGTGGGMRTGGAMGGAGGGMGGTGGAMGGVGGANGGIGGASAMNDPTWAVAKYPGLPPYKERRRIVGNVDWPNPEIFNLPTWEAVAYPTSIEVWYAQETLWVYEALISVVAETNKNYVDDIANAPVKCVEQMLIGQEAAIQWTTLKQTIGDLTGAAQQNAMGAGSSSSMMGSMGSSGSMGSGSMGMGMDGGVALTGSAEMQALTKIVYGRYLDGENKPLLASDAPPFAEFNKMPVCLKVVINQTKIPELLTQCANCAMPIDVKHIRISPDNNVPFVMPIPLENMASDASGGMMGGMGMMGGAMPSGSGMGGAAGGSGSGGARGAMGGSGGMGADGMGGMGGVDVGRSDLSQSEYGADAIRVEIYGVINIFNKPDQDTFGTGEEAKKSDSAADVAMTEAGAAENQAAADSAAAENASATDETATENADATATTPTENAPAADATETENAPETSTTP